MSTACHVVSTCLYGLVGVVSLVMALKSLGARTFLPFHEAASGRSWPAIDDRLQAVILALLRASGLGFLGVGLQLVLVSVGSWLDRNLVVALALPLVSLVFCVGLSVLNYDLHRRTHARTPWRGSVYAAVALAVALALSIAS